MIHLISKEYFYKTIVNNTKFIKYKFFNLKNQLPKEFIFPKYTFYYLLDGFGVFAYAYDTVYVPEIYKDTIDPGLIIKEGFTIDDWELKQVSPSITNKLYTINCFKSYGDQFKELYDTYKTIINEGDWYLINKITGEVLEFSIKLYGEYYNKAEKKILIAYPEKLETPINNIKCAIKENLITTILKHKITAAN